MKRDMERRLSAMEGCGRERMVIVSAYEMDNPDVAALDIGANDLLVRINKPTPCEQIIRVLAA